MIGRCKVVDPPDWLAILSRMFMDQKRIRMKQEKKPLSKAVRQREDRLAKNQAYMAVAARP